MYIDGAAGVRSGCAGNPLEVFMSSVLRFGILGSGFIATKMVEAVNALLPVNEVQLVNYLVATGIDDGMLINFGSERLEIRHRTRLYKRKQ